VTKQILPGIYKTDIPIPNNPLKSLNCYIIQSGDSSLVIDTGFNRPECRQALFESLDDLAVDLAKAKVFITHMHTDHAGLAADLAREGAELYCSLEDAEFINSGDTPFLAMDQFIRIGGFPAADLQTAFKTHPGYKYRNLEHVDFKIVADGDLLTVGDFQFVCIKTPGHTRGHMCLYEKEKKLLFSGDHILHGITPNISLWSDSFDPLRSYLDSLEIVLRLDVSLVLPGHRSKFTDLGGRVTELRQHHETRIKEVLSILKEKPQNAYQVAAQMTWALNYDTFEQFPVPQKWFAAGEALAHLKYLEGENLVTRTSREGSLIFAATMT